MVAVVVMVVEVLVTVELRVVRHGGQDLPSVRVSACVKFKVKFLRVVYRN